MPRNFNIKRSLTVENSLHLLQTLTLGLFYEGPDNNRPDHVQRGVEEEGVATPGPLHVWGYEGEEEVEEPLRGHCDGGADLSDAGGEDLALLVMW